MCLKIYITINFIIIHKVIIQYSKFIYNLYVAYDINASDYVYFINLI